MSDEDDLEIELDEDEFEDPGGKENSPLAQSPQKDASPLAQSPQGGFSDRRDSPRQDSPSDDGNEKATSEVGQDSVGQREEEKEEKEEFKPAAQKKKAAKAKEAVDELDAEDDGMGEDMVAVRGLTPPRALHALHRHRASAVVQSTSGNATSGQDESSHLYGDHAVTAGCDPNQRDEPHKAGQDESFDLYGDLGDDKPHAEENGEGGDDFLPDDDDFQPHAAENGGGDFLLDNDDFQGNG
ncbi:hypothetical protein T484DRAFT_1895192 [Baffinella frigidus]|nr:hypothetical protein T484DRAFT_1895192 [Cryptophyta sp. CCMP2293]